MAETDDKPIGAPLSSNQTTPEQPQPIQNTPTRRLNWKNFAIGVAAVIVIEWFAIHALGTNEAQLAPTLAPSKIPPSPTLVLKMVADWSTYTDTASGFSLQYPADKYTLDAKPGFSLDTLHITVMKDADPDINLGDDFAPTEYANVKNSIDNGTQFSSLQPGKKDTFKTVTINNINFVRVYPAATTNCQTCDQVKYITRVKGAFVIISMAKDFSATPSPTLPASQNPSPTIKLTKQEYEKQLLSDREKLMNVHFGDLEKILTTFKLLR